MFPIRLVIIAVVSSISAANMFEDMDQEQAEAAINCLTAIVCGEKKGIIIREIWIKLGPEMRDHLLTTFTKHFNVEMTDTPEFWDNYDERICIRPYDERKTYLKRLLIYAMEKYENDCKTQNDEECEGMNRAMAKFQMIQQEYTAKGVCYGAGNANNVVGKVNPMKIG